MAGAQTNPSVPLASPTGLDSARVDEADERAFHVGLEHQPEPGFEPLRTTAPPPRIASPEGPPPGQGFAPPDADDHGGDDFNYETITEFVGSSPVSFVRAFPLAGIPPLFPFWGRRSTYEIAVT